MTMNQNQKNGNNKYAVCLSIDNNPNCFIGIATDLEKFTEKYGENVPLWTNSFMDAIQGRLYWKRISERSGHTVQIVKTI